MNQRRPAFAQRNDRKSIRHWEEIEPTPDSLIPALAHRIEVRPREMDGLDLDFENAPAIRTLKNHSGSRLMATLRTTKLVNYTHGSVQRPLYYFPNTPLFPSLRDSVSFHSADGIGEIPAVILRSAVTKNLLWFFGPTTSLS